MIIKRVEMILEAHASLIEEEGTYRPDSVSRELAALSSVHHGTGCRLQCLVASSLRTKRQLV
jgi:hypothetical protein